jgi:hypothetical protein
MENLPTDSSVPGRLDEISYMRCKDFASKNFMAICLWRADSDRFEIDFHDLERYCINQRALHDS